MSNVIIHQSKISKLWIPTIILAITSLTFSSCLTNRSIRLRNKSIKESNTYQFKERKKNAAIEGENWTIYSRKIKGTNFLEYKIEGAIKATPKACSTAFIQDIRNQAADLKNKQYPVYKIVRESKDSLQTYVIHNEPFPLKDTEMSVRYIYSNKEDGSMIVTWQEAWDESQIQPTKQLNRVETFRGYWEFASTLGNYCQATNSVQFDPKGMPLWLVNPMVFKFLKKGLEDIRASTF